VIYPPQVTLGLAALYHAGYLHLDVSLATIGLGLVRASGPRPLVTDLHRCLPVATLSAALAADGAHARLGGEGRHAPWGNHAHVAPEVHRAWREAGSGPKNPFVLEEPEVGLDLSKQVRW
jgi:hypothetical protein